MGKTTRPQKVFPDVLDKKKKLAAKLTYMEDGNRVSIPELDRRVFNIPSLPKVLIEDSELKRRRKR